MKLFNILNNEIDRAEFRAIIILNFGEFLHSATWQNFTTEIREQGRETLEINQLLSIYRQIIMNFINAKTKYIADCEFEFERSDNKTTAINITELNA